MFSSPGVISTVGSISEFLSTVNEALQENDVVVGSTEIFLEEANYNDKVWSSVNDYNTHIMKSGRTQLGLAVPIDSDITAIKHEVIEKVQNNDDKVNVTNYENVDDYVNDSNVSINKEDLKPEDVVDDLDVLSNNTPLENYVSTCS